LSNANPGCLTPFLRMFGAHPSTVIQQTPPKQQAADKATWQPPTEQPLATEKAEVTPAEQPNQEIANQPVDSPLPYRINDGFLSRAELSFYGVLTTIVGQNAVICPQAGLGAIFFIPRNSAHYMSDWARISQRRIDFLLCQPGTMRPLAGIELDDKSHLREDRQARDAFVERVFATAGLPLLRFPVRSGYTPAELAKALNPVLDLNAAGAPKTQGAVTSTATPLVSGSEPPICPKCGVPMVLRTTRRGERAGLSFWGCVNYPRCHEMQVA
jgi:hypothetical protein